MIKVAQIEYEQFHLLKK